MSLTTYFIRRTFRSGDEKRDAGLTTPNDIQRWDDIRYGFDRHWQVLDAYRPRNAAGPLPVIVSIHGGGWTYGDKERYQYYCMDLAQRGFAVVNFTYRVAPEWKFPSGLHDTCLVFQWLLSQQDCGWFNLSHVYAVGDSAGAHMLTIYCAACSNPDYARDLGLVIPRGHDGMPFCPSRVGLNCGVYAIDFAHGNSLTRNLMKALLPSRARDEQELRLVCPVPFIRSFPPAYIVTANHDPLAGPPAQNVLTARLDELSVPYVDRTYGTQEAPQDHVFHCNLRNPVGRLCNDEECAFFLTGDSNP